MNTIRFNRTKIASKALETVLGIFQGIAIDKSLSDGELEYLKIWISEHQPYRAYHPFNEIIPEIERVIEDQIVTEEERDDVINLCHKLTCGNFRSCLGSDMQRLHGIMGGIIADCHIQEKELKGLRSWIDDHQNLRTCWPYDEVDSLITTIMADKKIDLKEHQMLMSFFSEFSCLADDVTITNPLIRTDQQTLSGVCSCCPEIHFHGEKFCFTGEMARFKRSIAESYVKQLGGITTKYVSPFVNYLVIGSNGNPCWAFACYGRKVEQAIQCRKEGSNIVLVHETDFLDALMDNGIIF
jgi:hypothetical protein